MADYYDIYELDRAGDHFTALFVATQEQCLGLIEAGVWEEEDLGIWDEIQADCCNIAVKEGSEQAYREVSRWLRQAD